MKKVPFQKAKRNHSRIEEIDILRGVAFLGMVLHHVLFFLQWKHVIPYGSVDWLLSILGPVVRITFIGLVGVSSWLWFLKYTQGFSDQPLYLRLRSNNIMRAALRRSLHVGTAAVVVSLFSAIFVPRYMINFGVLHLIAVSVILIVPFLAMPRLSTLVGLLLLVLGSNMHRFLFIPSELSWFIQASMVRPTLDYFPILPWFGFVLLGLGLAHVLYGDKPTSLVSLRKDTPIPGFPLLGWIGRNALVLYVIQLPLIVLVIELILIIS